MKFGYLCLVFDFLLDDIGRLALNCWHMQRKMLSLHWKVERIGQDKFESQSSKWWFYWKNGKYWCWFGDNDNQNKKKMCLNWISSLFGLWAVNDECVFGLSGFCDCNINMRRNEGRWSKNRLPIYQITRFSCSTFGLLSNSFETWSFHLWYSNHTKFKRTHLSYTVFNRFFRKNILLLQTSSLFCFVSFL